VTVTFIGTTLNGSTLEQDVTVSLNEGFKQVTLTSDFTALASVTWTPGVTLVDNILAAPLLSQHGWRRPGGSARNRSFGRNDGCGNRL